MSLKKEFNSVYWTNTRVWVNTRALTLSERAFFDSIIDKDESGRDNAAMMLPEGIKYTDVMAFQCKKVKVTIEVVE